jgi:DNA-binding MarR family transcriptional regulator
MSMGLLRAHAFWPATMNIVTHEPMTSAADSDAWGPGTAVLVGGWRLVRATGQLVTAELAVEGFTDLRPIHCLLLYRLFSGETQMTELAQQAGVTRQAVSLLVDQLHAAGYVERAVNPADRRARVLLLTDRGQTAAAAVDRCFQRIRERWAGSVGINRIRDSAGTLADMHAAIAGEAAGSP